MNFRARLLDSCGHGRYSVGAIQAGTVTVTYSALSITRYRTAIIHCTLQYLNGHIIIYSTLSITGYCPDQNLIKKPNDNTVTYRTPPDHRRAVCRRERRPPWNVYEW